MENNVALKKYSGSCLCQKVVFEIVGTFTGFFLCHCSRCRKETGSAHAANLFSKSAKLVWISGKEHSKTYQLPNTRFTKSFCEICGSALPTEKENRLVVPAGSLNCDIEIVPNAHIFIGSKANWDKDLDQVTKFDALPK